MNGAKSSPTQRPGESADDFYRRFVASIDPEKELAGFELPRIIRRLKASELAEAVREDPEIGQKLADECGGDFVPLDT